MSSYEIKAVLKYRGGRPGDPWGDDGEAKARATPMTQAGMNETQGGYIYSEFPAWA